MKMQPENLNDIVAILAAKHRSFGGGNVTEGNPISAALKDSPPQFAAGVDIRQVVFDVIELYKQLPKKKELVFTPPLTLK